MVLRIAGAIALLRECSVNNDDTKNDEDDEDDEILISSQLEMETLERSSGDILIKKVDFESALSITRYAVQTALIIFDWKSDRISNNDAESKNKISTIKQPIPKPENMSMEFLISVRHY